MLSSYQIASSDHGPLAPSEGLEGVGVGDQGSKLENQGKRSLGREWPCSVTRISTSTPGNCALSFQKEAPENLFLMVRTGKCTMLRNGINETYQAGQLILMFKGDALEEIESDYSFTADVVEFRMGEDGLGGDLAKQTLTSGHQSLSARNLMVPTLLQKIVRSVYLRGEKPSWKENAWLRVALLELQELQDPVMSEKLGLHDLELEKLCESIRENPHHNYSNAELASMLKLSLGHFVRLFRHHQKMSPREFVIQARMDRAKVLLKTTTLNISEISDATGYRDVYHFSRQFRQKVGSSPSGYRNMATPLVEV